MECQDFRPDRHTSGQLIVGQETASVFELCHQEDGDSPFDIDWFRVNLQFGRTYRFELAFNGTPFNNEPTIEIAGQYGIIDPHLNQAGNYYVEYTARFAGAHFISVFQGGLLSGTDYTINSVVVTDDDHSQSEPLKLWNGIAKYDRIESTADEDLFEFTLREGKRYFFSMVDDDDQLRGASLQLVGDGGQVLASDESAGARASFSYFAASGGVVRVKATAGQTPGGYRVMGFVIDEALMGRATQASLVLDGKDSVTTKGYIGLPTDIDWYRLQLTQGELIKITLQGHGLDYLATPTLIFRGVNGELISSQYVRRPDDAGSGMLEYYFVAKATGEHFVVARTNITSYIGEYELTVAHARTPLTKKFLFGRGPTPRLVTLPGENIALDSIIDTHGLKPGLYEIYAEAPLTRDGTLKDSNQLYSIPGPELDKWNLTDPIEGRADLFIRARAGGIWSQWQKFSVFGLGSGEELISDKSWENPQSITYRLVTELPTYYGAGEYPGFQSAFEIPELANKILEIAEFINATGLNLSMQPATGEQEADINIFVASGFASRTRSFLPGQNRGGDIIFNSSFFHADTDLSLGTVDYFNIVRAFAHSLGLNFIGGDTPQAETVMGGKANSAGLFPGTLGIRDLWALSSIYGTSIYDPSVTLRTSFFEIAPGNAILTITGQADEIKISPDLADADAMIDLRDGARNYVLNAGVNATEFYIGPGTIVYDATTRSGDDRLLGNGARNVLTSGSGDDFLIGYGANDRMFGGDGNDIYIHYFGDGQDFVSDTGGTDTLCFISRNQWDGTQLGEDYTFTRIGQFVDINLTLDGSPSEGSVRVDLGSFNNGRIESLELWHEGTLNARISLNNIIDQLADGQTQRFQALEQTDLFGNLVAPI